MASKRIAQASVVLSLMVLLLSVTVIVHGARHPVYYRPIARGETLPPLRMPDASGQLVALSAHRESNLLLVGVPSLNLSTSQRNWIAQMASQVEAAIPVNTVVITAEHHPTTAPTKICPTASAMLVDEDHSLLPLLGSSRNEAVLCVVDRTGQLVFRTRIPTPADATNQVAQLSAAELRQTIGSAAPMAQRE